ncbi:hypothetical protein ILUMI_19466 [Ignelater luminosus]|uniref:Uncharacterized protein n=1 Tax=Ignelater luminosus TaxID=2038154 RepID=A0A8K0CKG8_IGNLU|nr:hypothetical protein ILUMI_19466 [Ignelater luminosus]
MYKILIFIFIQVVVISVSSRQLPDFIHLCKRNDPNLNRCIINTFNEIRPYLKKGIPEIDIPPGEPLNFPNASANTGEGTSVTLQGTAWNFIANGILDVNVKELKMDFDQLRCSLVLEFPFVRLQGDYKFFGKVMLFEIDTTGKFDINSS